MEEIFKILDKLDKKENIYIVVKKAAARAHEILNGASSSVAGDTTDVVQTVIKEMTVGEDKK
jgi:DNA-directed RNA polymerase subunit K/omega